MKRFLSKISPIAAVVLLYVVIESVGITCPIRFVTGISCAGCGMSRAWLSLLRGDIRMAFYYHPLFLLPVVALLVWIFKNKLPQALYRFIMFTIVLLFVIIYMYRMIVVKGDIVVFEPENNILFRIIRQIKEYGG